MRKFSADFSCPHLIASLVTNISLTPKENPSRCRKAVNNLAKATRALSSICPRCPGHACMRRHVTQGRICLPCAPIFASCKPPGNEWPKMSKLKPLTILTTLRRSISSLVKTENSNSRPHLFANGCENRRDIFPPQCENEIYYEEHVDWTASV
ncbi:hypothetical protein GQX74_011114 [Glossina fuscipes]|nr:hypothetical protein GQX74_011114 [Glossina fuscipes]